MEQSNKSKKKLGKVLLWIGGIVLGLFLLFNVVFWFLVQKKLPDVLANNNSDYAIMYTKLDVSLLSRNLRVTDVKVTPKDSLGSNKQGIFATIKSLDINGIGLFKLAISDKIHVDEVVMKAPILHMYPVTKDSTKIKKEFEKIITLDELQIVDGGAFLYKTNAKDPYLKVERYNFTLSDLLFDKQTQQQKVPFTYANYTFKADSLHYVLNKFYTLKTKTLYTNDKSIEIEDFKLLPNYNRAAFLRELPKEADMFTVLIPKVALQNLDWGYKNEDLYVNASQLKLEKLNANIYRNKGLPDDTSIKPLYSKMLRELPFFLDLKQVLIKDATIVYDEEFDLNKDFGRVSFSNFYATISNIASGYKQKKLPKVTVDVKTKFYDVANLNVNWNFDILDTSDSFIIKGMLTNLPAQKVDKFIRPTFNVEATGTFKTLNFNYTGNNTKAWGDFAIDYDDLIITVLKNDSKKKNKLLTAVGNLFVKSDTKEKKKNTAVSFDRLQDKGFFNLLWKTTAQGLKETLLII